MDVTFLPVGLAPQVVLGQGWALVRSLGFGADQHDPTGEAALAYTHEVESRLTDAARTLKAQPTDVAARIAQIMESAKALESFKRLESEAAALEKMRREHRTTAAAPNGK